MMWHMPHGICALQLALLNSSSYSSVSEPSFQPDLLAHGSLPAPDASSRDVPRRPFHLTFQRFFSP